MTDLKDPKDASVFIVGYNPATAYMARVVDYDRFIESLFNKNDENCRRFYEEYRDANGEIEKKTRTRNNIEWLSQKLGRAGLHSIIETNVICYGAKNKKCMGFAEHKGGKQRGIEIFRTLVTEIRPKVIIIHSKGASDEFNGNFGNNFGFVSNPPTTKNDIAQVDLKIGSYAFVIPPLGEPGFRNWPKKPLRSFCHWADEYLDEVARRVAQICAPDRGLDSKA
jgi:hypothetical protein